MVAGLFSNDFNTPAVHLQHIVYFLDLQRLYVLYFWSTVFLNVIIVTNIGISYFYILSTSEL